MAKPARQPCQWVGVDYCRLVFYASSPSTRQRRMPYRCVGTATSTLKDLLDLHTSLFYVSIVN